MNEYKFSKNPKNHNLIFLIFDSECAMCCTFIRWLDLIYKNYSKLIPIIGEFVVGDKKPYEYLTKSISEFVDQDELIDLMKKNKFEKCKYNNFNGGIVALHSAWKL